MEAKLNQNLLIVTKSPGEKFKNESAVWFALKKLLNSKGLDVIKKQAYKDWHMVCEGVYYLRDRKYKYFFFDDQYQVRNLAQDLNTLGGVSIMAVWNDDSPSTKEKVSSMLS